MPLKQPNKYGTKITVEEILINDREKELIEKTQKIIENIKNNEYNSIKFGIFER